MGSKAKLATHIVPFLMADHDQTEEYVEPFVGGGNIFSLVPAKKKWGNDLSFYAVELLKAVAEGWDAPEELDEQTYNDLRERARANDETDAALIGFAAFCCSYAGKEWGGFWRSKTSQGKPRNGASEQSRNLAKQRQGLLDARWTCMDYTLMDIKSGSTVYCDPPYSGTTKYRAGFSHDAFWGWCEALAEDNCRVFVSEFSAPQNWQEIWAKDRTTSLTKNTGAKSSVERLYTLA